MEKIKKISLFWISKQQRKQILRKKIVRVRKQRRFKAEETKFIGKSENFKFKKRENNGLGIALIRRILESEIFYLIIGKVVFLVRFLSSFKSNFGYILSMFRKSDCSVVIA